MRNLELKSIGYNCNSMLSSKIIRLDALFIVVFGVIHFAIPFVLPPNLANTSIFGYAASPGAIILGILSLVYYFSKNRFAGVFLSFLYAGGIFFHALFLSGVFPAILIVPNASVLVVGLVLDVLVILTIIDFYRRTH
jgi:hypothetical protein